MDGRIWYLNTDLDIRSARDLKDLAAGLTAGGMYALHMWQEEDESWFATFAMDGTYEQQHTEPDSNIAAMLEIIEALPGPLAAIWAGCTQREFNIGYDCGSEPWAFNQGLSNRTLARLAKAGATLRITIYPDRQ